MAEGALCVLTLVKTLNTAAQLREIQRNSTAASAPAADWVLLSVEFTSPPWVSYADVRFVALGNGTAYVDDVWFGQTALAPPRATLPR